MDFDNARIDQLVGRMATLLPKLTNEEATKASLVTPFIAALGYDVHDPNEVMREFGADAGRGGEAVDYAIVERGKPIIMIEAKHHEVTLKEQQERQLRRYFNATPECRVGILTNGLAYKAFSDIHAQNVMDDRPFCEWDMRSLSPEARKQMRDLSKHVFSVEAVTASAEAAHYGTMLHEMLRAQMSEPDPLFVRWWGKQVYEGTWTARIAARFAEITKTVLREFVGKEVAAALAAVSANGPAPAPPRKRRKRRGMVRIVNVAPGILRAGVSRPAPQDLMGRTIGGAEADYRTAETLWAELRELCGISNAPTSDSAYGRLRRWFGIEVEEVDPEAEEQKHYRTE